MKILAKEVSLKKKKDFEQVFEKGKGFKDDFLFLKVFPNNLGKNRFAIIVSRKISKKAIIRNKIKRRIRVIIKQKLSEIKKGIDLVLVVVSSELVKKDFKEVEKKINKLFQKANIIEHRG